MGVKLRIQVAFGLWMGAGECVETLHVRALPMRSGLSISLT